MTYFDAAREGALEPTLADEPGGRQRPVLRVRRASGSAVTAADIRESRRECREIYSRNLSSRVSPWAISASTA